MKVSGRLDLLQSNIDYYLKLTSTKDFKTVEALRKFYFDNFMSDARRNMSISAEMASKEVKEELNSGIILDSLENNKIEDIHGTFLNDLYIELPKEEITIEKGTNSASGFLNAIKAIQSSDIASNNIVQDTSVEEVRGTFLDDEPVLESEITYTEEDIVEDKEILEGIEIHGTYLDDIEIVVENEEDNVVGDSVEVEEVNNINEGYKENDEEIHGIFLDDITLEDISENDEEDDELPFTENINPVVKDEDDSGDISSFIFGEPEEVYKPSDKLINFPDVETGDVSLEISKKDEPLSVPPTVREFLKANPGSEISFVKQFYSEKKIQSELKLNKIYKKGSKLFI